MTKKSTTTAFLVLRPELNHSGNVTSFKAVRVTQTQPKSLSDYEMFIQVSLTVPLSVFDAQVRAHIDVPESAVMTLAEVEVRDEH